MSTPAGWYPADDGGERYWDGVGWTDHVRHATAALGLPLPAVAAPATRASSSAMVRGGRQFAFNGGAATYLGTGVLALLVTVLTLGICYPFAVVLRERWRCRHSFINGQQLLFSGSALGLLGHWIKWLLLLIITVGIYGFWVGPRIARWKWENTGFVAHVVATPA